ncbi:MAG: hypothetical protein AAGH38_05570, partial [Pseudomonadota bacterium]
MRAPNLPSTAGGWEAPGICFRWGWGIFAIVFRILTAPFRWLSRIFGSRASRAAQKAGAGYAARRADSGEVAVGGTDETEEAASQPSSRSGFLFTRLARPMLAERTAADLSLDEAREHALHAQSFYANAFTLFPRGDFFYEEVEQEYLDAV